MESLLAALLDCGYLDIQILDDCNYDLGEIVEDLKFEGIEISLNAITDAIFMKGQRELTDAVEELLNSKKADLDELKEDADELSERSNQLQSDIEDLDEDEDAEEIDELSAELENIEDQITNRDEQIEELEEEIEELEVLDPESDMEWFCNCLDTSCWFSDNEEIYRKYFESVIDDIEYNMGFTF